MVAMSCTSANLLSLSKEVRRSASSSYPRECLLNLVGPPSPCPMPPTVSRDRVCVHGPQ